MATEEQPLEVLRDEACEKLAGIKIESCSAFWDEEGEVVVVGEVATISGRSMSDYAEVHVAVHAAGGRLLAAETVHLGKVGIRKVFETSLEPRGRGAVPASVRVYPIRDDN